MGGKKKTKWRKLPLEEFTSPTKPEKVPSDDACQIDLTREENNYIPSYSEPNETAQNYTEPYEHVDGLWYPTSCVVYNPAEFGLYSNYMMPLDPSYFYYTTPEVPQIQEYVPVPFQEYASVLPKDTVYLLLPTQTLRPSQPVQNLAPEWQNRRRRRRYEGYAEYAVIPEKPNSTKVEEKNSGKAIGQHVNSRRNSAQFNNFRRMTSFSETSKFDCNSVLEQNPSCSKSNDVKKNFKSSTDINGEKGPMSVNKEIDSVSKENDESNQKFKKNLEMCGVHSKNTTEKKESQAVTENINSNSLTLKNELQTETGVCTTDKENKETPSCKLSSDISSSSYSSNPIDNLSSHTHTPLDKKKIQTSKSKEYDKTDDVGLCTSEVSGHGLSLLGTDQGINTKTKTASLKLKEGIAVDNLMHSCTIEKNSKANSQSSLPDILSTLSKPPPNEKIREPDGSSGSQLSDGADLDRGITPKSKSLLSQSSYLPNFLSSEALHDEMEMELKQLQSLHSLQANQSIYKLAYDENVTDQSEADSRSPSPVDPESQVPSSLTSAEILIHEADSGSDAGSEDVELIPHRYESETFLNENKHVYVNKLSLAVELLRTQESLPYDDEFKRVVGENNQPNNIVPVVHTGGKVNLGFVEDSCSPNVFSTANHFENKSASASTNVNVVSQHQLKQSANSSNDSAIFSDIDFDSFEDELCEPAKEAAVPGSEIQDNTEEIRAGYRRFGVQARHYLTPRGAAISLNPCFCCIIL